MTENQKVFDLSSFSFSFINPLLDLVLEAALGYAGAIGTSLMDELASLNERCDSSVVDVKMEDLDRRVVALVDEGIVRTRVFTPDFSLLFCLTHFTFVNFSYLYDTNLFSYLPFILSYAFILTDHTMKKEQGDDWIQRVVVQTKKTKTTII